MSGVHAASALRTARTGLEAAVRAALADEKAVDIYSHFQWPAANDDWVAMGDASKASDAKILDKARRQRNEQITVLINIGAWRPGRGQDVAQSAFDRAHDLLDRIEAYLSAGDNTTLGGAVISCLPGDAEAAGAEYEGGYQVEIAAEFVCTHRVRASITEGGSQ